MFVQTYVLEAFTKKTNMMHLSAIHPSIKLEFFNKPDTTWNAIHEQNMTDFHRFLKLYLP